MKASVVMDTSRISSPIIELSKVKRLQYLLAAAMKLECILKVIKGSGRFLKNVLDALVMVFVSHSRGSSKLNFSAFFLSRPAVSSLVTLDDTPTTLK